MQLTSLIDTHTHTQNKSLQREYKKYDIFFHNFKIQKKRE
jgi:hypothetical protein